MRIGIDIGGTKADAVAVRDGRLLARHRVPVRRGAEGVVATILDAVDAVTSIAGGSRHEVTTLGIGLPGQVRPGTTVVSHAVNLDLHDVDLGAALRAVLPAAVAVDNDVNAAAYGVWLERRRAGLDGSLVYLNLGTGVAAASVVDGRVWLGSGGVAGEIGHLAIALDGPACPCGQRGCIEAFVGGRALAQRWPTPAESPVADLFEAAEAGDAVATRLVEEAIGALAVAVHVLALTVDADAIILGGGVTTLGDRLMAPLRRRLGDAAEPSPFLRSLALPERISLLDRASPACALGAAALEPSTVGAA